MAKKIVIKTQLNRGRPRKAVDKSMLPEKVDMSTTPTIGELPKKIVGSHMGYMNSGGNETPPSPSNPTIGKPAKLPPRPKTMPPH